MYLLSERNISNSKCKGYRYHYCKITQITIHQYVLYSVYLINRVIKNGAVTRIKTLDNHINMIFIENLDRRFDSGLRTECPSLVSLPHSPEVKMLLYDRLSHNDASSVRLTETKQDMSALAASSKLKLRKWYIVSKYSTVVRLRFSWVSPLCTNFVVCYDSMSNGRWLRHSVPPSAMLDGRLVEKLYRGGLSVYRWLYQHYCRDTLVINFI